MEVWRVQETWQRSGGAAGAPGAGWLGGRIWIPGEEVPPDRLTVKLVLDCGCNCVGLASVRAARCFVHGLQAVREMRLLAGHGRPRPNRSRAGQRI